MKKLYRYLSMLSNDISWLGFTITFVVGFLLASTMFWFFGNSIITLLVSFIL